VGALKVVEKKVSCKPSAVQGQTDTAEVTLGEMGIVPPLMPAGEYVVGWLRAEQGEFRGRKRWFLWFRIVEGLHVGEELYLCCPFPKDERRSFGLGSKLVAAMTMATGQTPRRRDRLSTRVFAGKYFVAKVRTVTTDQDCLERSPEDHYSVIEKLIAIAAGTPSLGSEQMIKQNKT
jgi:hypothetical protein